VSDHTAEIHPFPTPAPEEVSAETNTETTDESLVHETLVEEVSIDGMCGVY
jgi:mycofactocin precursor